MQLFKRQRKLAMQQAPAWSANQGNCGGAHQVVGDGGYTVYDVHDRSLRQTAAATELLARVDAGIRTLGQLARLAGAIGGGFLATELGTRGALTLAAAILGAAAIVACARVSLRRNSSRTSST